MFIKDGPLGFFGQTANMYKPMRELMIYLDDKYEINLIGIEKSGAFTIMQKRFFLWLIKMNQNFWGKINKQ